MSNKGRRRRLGFIAGAACVSLGIGCSSGDSSSPVAGTPDAQSPDSSSGSASGSSSGSGSASGSSSGSGSASGSSSGSVTDGGTPADATLDSGVDSAVDSGGGTEAAADAPVPDSASDAAVTSEAAVDAGTPAEGGSDGSDEGSASDASADGAPEAGPLLNYTFDTTTEGWSILSTNDPTSDAGALMSSALSWTGTLGSPTPGVLEASVPFTNNGQSVEIGFRPSPLLDLTGKVITMQVYLVSGLSTDPANPGGVKVFAQDGPAAASPYLWVDGGWQNLGSANAGQWITIALDMTAIVAANPTFDPTQVGAWGIQVNTGGVAATPPYSAAVVAIDSVTVQ